MESFSAWYYRVVVVDGLKIWQSLILLTFDTFSIPLLAKTLFTPWRRDVSQPEQPGLNQIFQAMAFNFVARLIGLVIRVNTILVGLALTLLIATLGAGLLIVLALLPTVIFFGIITAVIFLTNQILFGVGIFMITIAFFGLAIAYAYYRQVARFNPPLPEPLETMSLKLKAGKSVNVAPYIEGHLLSTIKFSHSLTELFSQLLQKPEVRFISAHATLPSDVFRGLSFPSSIEFRQVIIEAATLACAASIERITAASVFIALLRLNPNSNYILARHHLTIDDLVAILNWHHRLYKLAHQPSPLLNPSQLKTTGGIGRDWAAGYTQLLEQFARELTSQLSRNFGDHFLAHSDEIDQAERVLGRSGKHNVLLVGEPGIGKRTVMLGLTWRIHFGQTVRPLRHKRVLELDVSALLAGASNAGELEARLVGVLNDAVSAGNIILFIDRIERLFGSEQGETGSVNAGQILIPYLESSSLQLVGTTSFKDYHQFFERAPNVVTQFERVEVREPTPSQVLLILQEITPFFETRHGIIVTYQALKEVVNVSQRYITNRKFPEKAIDLLDEAAIHLTSSGNDHILLGEHIDAVVSQKTNVPVGQIQLEEKDKLLHLETRLHERVINQTEAIEAIAQALRRARSGVARTDRPIGTFLFLGPNGVGKTETAKSLAEVYFGSEKTMIRFDMNEYQEVQSINRLIGGPGFEAGGLLTNAVKERPFSVVLLDEIEKAHPNVLNLFLQLLDEGRLADAIGDEIDFTNTIIIGTSNAGSEMIRQRIQSTDDSQLTTVQHRQAVDRSEWNAGFKNELLDYLQHSNIFRPEFLNRFDAVVAFRPLNQDELTQIVGLQVKRINKNLADKQMSIVMTPQAANALAVIGFDPQFGARALSRAMQRKVENLIADKILRNQLQAGQVLEITEEMVS